jgi:hypothetical protein
LQKQKREAWHWRTQNLEEYSTHLHNLDQSVWLVSPMVRFLT